MSAKLIRITLLALSLAPSTATLAWSPKDNPDLQLHGYLAQGVVSSHANNLNGDSSNGGSAEFREAGLNFSFRPRGDLLLSAQAASVRQGEATREDLLLDYAVVDYSAWQGASGKFGIRGGKLKLPFGFYNDARDAVHTRPGILLPQSIYLDADGARAFGYFSLPGAALFSDLYRGRHNLYIELGGFPESALGDGAEVAAFRAQVPGKFRHRESWILRAADEIDGGRWRVALTVGRGDLFYVPESDPGSCFVASQQRGEPPLCRNEKFRLDQAFLSLQYNAENWSLTSELVRRRIEFGNALFFPPEVLAQFQQAGMTPPSSKFGQDSTGFYLQGTWRFSPRLSVYGRYDDRAREMQDRSGQSQSQRTGQPRHYFFARDWSAGMRYEFGNGLGLWLEGHYIDGAGSLNPLDNPDLGAGRATRYWSLATAMVAWRF